MACPYTGRRRLFGEHVLQALQHGDDGWTLQLAEGLHQTVDIDRPKLIERDEACAALKAASMRMADATRIDADFHGTDCNLATFTGRVVLTKGG